MKEVKFSFEELEVWKKAVTFSTEVIQVAENIQTNRKHFKLIEQLESSSTSIALNIAEGKGRFSKKEFVRFLYIARGSLFETITLLIIFKNLNFIAEEQLMHLKTNGDEIGKMITGLIRAIE
jgi:four helix bundle protein